MRCELRLLRSATSAWSRYGVHESPLVPVLVARGTGRAERYRVLVEYFARARCVTREAGSEPVSKTAEESIERRRYVQPLRGNP